MKAKAKVAWTSAAARARSEAEKEAAQALKDAEKATTKAARVKGGRSPSGPP